MYTRTCTSATLFGWNGELIETINQSCWQSALKDLRSTAALGPYTFQSATITKLLSQTVSADMSQNWQRASECSPWQYTWRHGQEHNLCPAVGAAKVVDMRPELLKSLTCGHDSIAAHISTLTAAMFGPFSELQHSWPSWP